MIGSASLCHLPWMVFSGPTVAAAHPASKADSANSVAYRVPRWRRGGFGELNRRPYPCASTSAPRETFGLSVRPTGRFGRAAQRGSRTPATADQAAGPLTAFRVSRMHRTTGQAPCDVLDSTLTWRPASRCTLDRKETPASPPVM